MRRALLRGLIALLWAVAMLALWVREHPPGAMGPSEAASPVDRAAGQTSGEQWAGIYRGTEKVGYAMSRLDTAEDGYRAEELAVMRVLMMGEPKDIRMSTDALLDEALRLRSFRLEVASDVSLEVSGRVEEGELVVSMQSGGARSERRVPLGDVPSLDLALGPMLRGADLFPGSRIRLPILDPATLAPGEMVLRVEAEEPITVMGEERRALRLRGTVMGAELVVWTAPDGEVFRQEAAGLTFVREAKEDAVRLGRPSLDLVADTAVPVTRDLPRGTKYLKVRLAGADLDGLELDGGSQRFRDSVLEVRSVEPVAGAAAGGDLSSYLAATPYVESTDPDVMDLARRVTGEESETLAQARLIFDWVYANIEKAPTISVPQATSVLHERRGDCNEHTTLFTALARAAGVPARMASGLVYQGGRFYYHAWPEVWAGRWVPVDPTLGQWPADATHIRLLTGGLERQARLLSVIGKLRIEILEYEGSR